MVLFKSRKFFGETSFIGGLFVGKFDSLDDLVAEHKISWLVILINESGEAEKKRSVSLSMQEN